MRIVHLGKYYPPAPGGIENVTRTLAQGQAARGADVTVIVVNHAAHGRDVTFERLTTTPSVEEWDGPVRVIRVGRWANFAKLDVSPGLAGVLRRELRQPPDVWHLHAPNVTMMLAVQGYRLKPLVIHHHSDIVRQRFLKHFVWPLERAVYAHAACIVPSSAAYAGGSDLLTRYQGNVEPIPLGIDLAPFASPSPAALAYAERLNREYGEPLWLSAGRLIYYKGFHVGLEALRQVPGKWLVIGTGPLHAELQRRTMELGVADRVIWHGHASDAELVGAYHAATAFWFPSMARSEGFGLVQVEAMAAGCPVINTTIPASGVPWVSLHEVSGLTVPINDPAAFAAAANRLVGEPGLRQKLADGARARARAEFDQNLMHEHWLEVYRRVIR